MEVKLRTELPDDYKWDLSHLYKNLLEFNIDYDQVELNISELKNYQFKNLSIPEILKDCLDLTGDINKTLSKMFVYAQRYFDQEQNNEDADKLVQKISDLATKFSENSVFITDEIVHFEDEIIEIFLKSEKLKDYHFDIKNAVKKKKHILSKVEEELMSKLSDVFSTSNDVYTIFKNTELKYSRVEIQDGSLVTMDSQNFKELRESGNREDRKLAFDTFWKTYDDYKNTFSKLMFKFMKNIATTSKIRNYKSSLDWSLSSEDIPVDIYDNLIKNVSNNLDKFHDYLNFRKEILDYDELYYYDLYNPIVDIPAPEYSDDEAKDLVIKSTSVFGEEYTEIMRKAFNDSWIDVYPNKFKDTGAYMSGSAYDVHPYILLNYSDRYDDVSTVAHELGHAAHSVFSNENQIYNKSSYSTFIAEIASTTNEILLFDYMYKNTDDKQEKIFLLNNYIEHFRTTVFRQTMFAEFEKFMYNVVEEDEVLTASTLNDKYLELLEKYHGTDKNIMSFDKVYANEWSYIPHFYYNFYVYTYATSFISSVIISTKILNGDKEQLEKYLTLLKSGGSDYPVELLKTAGLDLTDENCYKIAFDEFSKHLTELKNLLSE